MRQSVTPEDEGCQALMCERLEAIGFKVEHLRFDDVDHFWAVRGDEGPIFAFAGHTDVVPTGDDSAWKFPPFEPTIEDINSDWLNAERKKSAPCRYAIPMEIFGLCSHMLRS